MQSHIVNTSVLAAPHTLDCGQGAVAHQCWTQSVSEAHRVQNLEEPRCTGNTREKVLKTLDVQSRASFREPKWHLPMSELWWRHEPRIEACGCSHGSEAGARGQLGGSLKSGWEVGSCHHHLPSAQSCRQGGRRLTYCRHHLLSWSVLWGGRLRCGGRRAERRRGCCGGDQRCSWRWPKQC